MKRITPWFLILLTLSSTPTLLWALMEEDVGEPFNGKIDVVVVGYDVNNNAEAKDMIGKMAKAAQDSGAVGKALIAGTDKDALGKAMSEAVSSVSGQSQPPAKPTLKLLGKTAQPGEKIGVVYDNCATTNKAAWIALYQVKADNKHYFSYTFLNNLTDKTYDMPAPDEPGDYNFRIFVDESYNSVAISETIQVR